MVPVVLDLFCGSGGAAMGWHRAGFRVIGVDDKPQPRYPFEFHRMDWRDGVRQFGTLAGIVHASPPCQHYSMLNRVHRNDHPRLIAPVRCRLLDLGRPYVIENVEGAAQEMLNPVMLCGVMFGLGVIRHRMFECSLPVDVPDHTPHPPGLYSPTGHGDPNWRNRANNPHLRGPGYSARAKAAMGVEWMTRDGMAQAIPPAFTEWIGRQAVAYV